MKLLFFLLLPFTFQAQTLDSLQKVNAQLNSENQELLKQCAIIKSIPNELAQRLDACEETVNKLAILKHENETLRQIMRTYVHQIDTLNTILLRQTALYNLDKAQSDSIQQQCQKIIDLQQMVIEDHTNAKLLDSIKLSNANIRLNMYKGLNDITENNLTKLQLQVDSLESINQKQAEEIKQLQIEFQKGKDRTETKPEIIQQPNINLVTEEELIVKMKLTINAEGKVI